MHETFPKYGKEHTIRNGAMTACHFPVLELEVIGPLLPMPALPLTDTHPYVSQKQGGVKVEQRGRTPQPECPWPLKPAH